MLTTLKRQVVLWLIKLTALYCSRPIASSLQLRLARVLKMQVTRPVFLGRGFQVHKPRNVSLGSRAFFSANAHLIAYERIEIGDDFLCAEDLLINTGTHDPVTLKPVAAPVRIGHRVWCGARVTIGAGVTIGDDVVIGAGAVVLKDIPSETIAVGVPCKPLRELKRNDKTVWSAFANPE